MSEISEEERYKARVEIEHNFVKGLILINAGAAASMLAFLQAIWIPAPDLRKIVLVGVILFSGGVFWGALVNLFRYLVNASRSAGNRCQYKSFLFCSYGTRILSLLSFLAGVLYVGLKAIKIA